MDCLLHELCLASNKFWRSDEKSNERVAEFHLLRQVWRYASLTNRLWALAATNISTDLVNNQYQISFI
jgi:hypothetical protein